MHDAAARRVVLLDSTLATVRVVLDSAASGQSKYGRFAGRLIDFPGDSALFLDLAAQSLLVIDSEGGIARVASVPRPMDAGAMVTAETPRVDAGHRLVYRIGLRGRSAGARSSPLGAERHLAPDTAAIVRVGLETRVLDTVARFRIRQWPGIVRFRDSVDQAVVTRVNPLEPLDDWTMFSDGTVVVVRGAEYRLELVRADGSRHVTPKLPYEWVGIDDSTRIAFIAYLETRQEARLAAGRRERAGKPPMEPREVAALMRRAQQGALDVPHVRYQFVDPLDLPGFRPAVVARSARPSPENTIWVRTLLQTPTDSGIVYDVLDVTGARVDRVRVAEGRTLAALDVDVALLVFTDGDGGVRLERVRRKP